MAEFMYNNVKNASTDHMACELNYSFHAHVFFGDGPLFKISFSQHTSRKAERIDVSLLAKHTSRSGTTKTRL